MQEQEEQEFLEWCGWKPLRIHMPMSPLIDGWENPKPNTSFDQYQVHLPALDLNNLFRYAVPKLLEEKKNPALSITFTWDDAEDKCMCDISPYNWGEDKDPAQALYQAIQGVRKLC